MESQRHETSHSKPVVGAWVRIDDDCPVSHRVLGTETEFVCGFGQDVFEFVLGREALREFLRHGAEALEAMNTR
ncbi:MAG TPA: hypothetical protein VHH15_13530 [Actinophytocola sp.]|nr:hypothetical protein [Actinophytocola sp.]